MRVLWLSPWMRTLSRVHADALRTMGDDVRIVTSDQHPESGPARDDEWVVDPRPRTPRTWPEHASLYRRARAWRPDVVVTEIVRDPRWTALGALAPRVDLVHDDRPHDAAEERPRWERMLMDPWASRARLTVCFSDHVAAHVDRSPVAVVPLASDLPDADVPPFVTARDRRDVVLAGRLNGYKNLPVVLEAWERHRHGPGHRGDDLVLLGDGDVGPLPPGVRWQRGPFRYADALPVLSHAKASLVHYRRATQSGVQVLAMQLGVTPVVSPEGALAEMQPPGAPVVGVDDVAGLVDALDALADPQEAERLGRAAREAYVARHAPEVVGRALHDALARAVAR